MAQARSEHKVAELKGRGFTAAQIDEAYRAAAVIRDNPGLRLQTIGRLSKLAYLAKLFGAIPVDDLASFSAQLKELGFGDESPRIAYDYLVAVSEEMPGYGISGIIDAIKDEHGDLRRDLAYFDLWLR